ncbi:MAG: DNA translocase FtsK 4TM domain-containing protein, partial [Bacteroidetes bacterium]|nr:DNA translocase FtsK 4TM domain-containing protein [Bacteroidota bacterium]
MAKKVKNTKSTSKTVFYKNPKFQKVLGLVLILFAFLLFVSFLSHIFTANADEVLVEETIIDDFGNETTIVNEKNALGKLGVILSNFFVKNMFGIPAFFITFLLTVYGANLLFSVKQFKWKKITYHSVFLMFYLSALFEFVRAILFPNSFFHPGGYVGYYLAGAKGWLVNNLKFIGTAAVLLVFGLSYLVITFDISFDKILLLFKSKKKKGNATSNNLEEEGDVPISMNESIFEKDKIDSQTTNIDEFLDDDDNFDDEEDEEGSVDFVIKEKDEEGFEKVNKEIYDTNNQTNDTDEDLELDIEEAVEEEAVLSDNDNVKSTNYDPTLDLSNYNYPPLSILENHGGDKVNIDKEELENNKDQIVETLRNYKIEISKIKATVGPTVTLYEIIPAPGIRISKIKNLEDDIALSLAALGIRIIAPIPGKGTIGIEVPNANKEVVSIKSILSSEKFKNTKFDLPIALGKNIANEIFITDLTKMPHLLMAGATGQGKSVGINAILVSLLYKKHPSQLKFVLVDPKKVELSIYNAIEKHFLAILPGEEEAIITNEKKVVA